MAVPDALRVGVLEKTTALPERVIELTVTETELPTGEVSPETEIVNVASGPLDANRTLVGPVSIVDVEVDPADVTSVNVTEPILGAARNDNASVKVVPNVCSEVEESAAET